MSPDAFVATLALIGGVVIVAALLSGLIDRTGLPQVALFLLLGATLGPAGLGLVSFGFESSALRSVAILALVLVLFTDAVTIDLPEVRQHRRLASVVLGPGTLASAALIAVAAWWLLGLEPASAAILGAALASTDPVLLRGLLRRPDVPPAARQALGLESGLNDIVLLPIVLVAMAFLAPGERSPAEWSRLGIDLFVLGPGAGVAVGLVGIGALDAVRRRFGVRRDYESLYALGVALAAYAAAEAVQGSGFLAAFAAGITIAALDVELCDCFLDYGQATAEMFLLFAFVAFGSGLIWTGLSVIDGRTLLFAGFALIVRTAVLWPALRALRIDPTSRRLIMWFGPRGLSSLLLVLLPVFAGFPGGERLFAICALVVLVSVVVHSVSLFLIRGALDAGPGSPGAGSGRALDVIQPGPAPTPTEKISLSELQGLWSRGEPVIVLDVRTERSRRKSDSQARGAIRLPPDDTVRRASELALPRNAWLVAYCA